MKTPAKKKATVSPHGMYLSILEFVYGVRHIITGWYVRYEPRSLGDCAYGLKWFDPPNVSTQASLGFIERWRSGWSSFPGSSLRVVHGRTSITVIPKIPDRSGTRDTSCPVRMRQLVTRYSSESFRHFAPNGATRDVSSDLIVLAPDWFAYVGQLSSLGKGELCHGAQKLLTLLGSSRPGKAEKLAS
jgi:hypothetical protein